MMPRPRFPSDEKRRKTRPHVKIHLTCRSHPRYGEVFDDPESRGIAWGLWFLAVQYFAPNDGGKVTLGRGDLAWLTGRTQWQSALNSLRTLCERLEYPVSVEGQRVTITIRNLRRKQYFTQQNQGSDSALRTDSETESGGATRTPHPPEAEADTDTEAEGSATPKTSSKSKARNPKRKPRTPETLCPEDLTPEQWLQVQAWRDRKHPELDDRRLRIEWEKHSAFWRTEEKPRRNWVASFEKWLLKALEIQKSDPRAERSQPPAVVREKPPPPMTKEQLDAQDKELDRLREGTRLRPRKKGANGSGNRGGRQGPSDSEPDKEEK